MFPGTLFAPDSGSLKIDGGKTRAQSRKLRNPLRNLPFRSGQVWQEDQVFAADPFEDQVTLRYHLTQRLLDYCGSNLQQQHGFGQEATARKGAMSIPARLDQHVTEAGTCSIYGISRDTQFLGDVI